MPEIIDPVLGLFLRILGDLGLHINSGTGLIRLLLFYIVSANNPKLLGYKCQISQKNNQRIQVQGHNHNFKAQFMKTHCSETQVDPILAHSGSWQIGEKDS